MKFRVEIYLLYIFFFSYSVHCIAQERQKDSLLMLLKKDKEDTTQAIHHHLLFRQYYFTGNYDSALYYAESELKLAQKINFQKGIAQAYNNRGLIDWNKGNYDKALENHFSALKIRETIGDMMGVATSFVNIGLIYKEQGNHNKALENYFSALKTFQKTGDKFRIAVTYSNIGIVYFALKDYDKSLENLSAALKIQEEIGDKGGIAQSTHNIGNIYAEQENFSKALENLFISADVRNEIGDKKGVAASYITIGEIYTRKEDYHNAIIYLQKGIDISKELGAKDFIMPAYKALSQIYDETKEYDNAYKYHKLYSEVKDSIFNEASSRQITEMQTKYETEKKEQQITLLNKDKELQDAQLNRQKIIIWSVAGGLLVVLILSIFIFRERRKSEKLLLNILPAETAKELKRNGKATARHYESVTVMFTDFKGFTSIAEKLSAEELVSELDFLFKKFDEIISRYNIEKIKTIGDAYMCASGLPTPNSNHAEYIIQAAIEIQNWMTAQNNKWNLRIGIHTGAVTAGVVGDKKFAYDIWGDTVNTASRMESSGEPNKINISGVTHELIKHKFKCEFRGKIPAKNKGEIEMYFVERAT